MPRTAPSGTATLWSAPPASCWSPSSTRRGSRRARWCCRCTLKAGTPMHRRLPTSCSATTGTSSANLRQRTHCRRHRTPRRARWLLGCGRGGSRRPSASSASTRALPSTMSWWRPRCSVGPRSPPRGRCLPWWTRRLTWRSPPSSEANDCVRAHLCRCYATTFRQKPPYVRNLGEAFCVNGLEILAFRAITDFGQRLHTYRNASTVAKSTDCKSSPSPTRPVAGPPPRLALHQGPVIWPQIWQQLHSLALRCDSEKLKVIPGSGDQTVCTRSHRAGLLTLTACSM
mmetsp:Transcript_31547/g.94823  ORF Transcript_31547/g.94823 Transcript_31547/m.94823 type:complete len:285 (-) Transcript_31547:310-1164(-)